MAGVVRKTIDHHVGHASPTPNPFHQTSYAEGSPTVYVETYAVVRVGDKTSCGDPAVGYSPNVYANGIKIHRLGDATGGHGSWVANAAASSSETVFANGGVGASPDPSGTTVTENSTESCDEYNWETLECED